jgi:hypothetical protein
MAEYRRYRRALPSTKRMTAKIVAFAAAATLAIGGLIAAEMAAGNDPALAPKATAQKTSTSSSASGSSSSSGSDPGVAPYVYPYPSSGSNGVSPGSDGYSTQQSSPPPVTSSTS